MLSLKVFRLSAHNYFSTKQNIVFLFVKCLCYIWYLNEHFVQFEGQISTASSFDYIYHHIILVNLAYLFSSTTFRPKFDVPYQR